MRSLLLLFLLMHPSWGEVPNPSAGTVLPAPPPVPPGGLVHAPPPSMERGVAAWIAGDERLAVIELEGWLSTREGPWGRSRAAGQFLLGWIHLHEGHFNLASARFTSVRVGAGPLAPYAAWYEALADHKRGRHAVAARECEAYRKQWPEGPHAEECLVLMGDAWVAAGLRQPAIDAYTAYLEANPGTPREEELRLGIVLAEANANPERGARLLAELALSHDYHCNGVAAQQLLDELIASGVEAPQIDPVLAEELRALTLRECGFTDEAWDSFQHLAADHADDPGVTDWVERNRDRFAWRTHQYQALGDAFAAAWREDHNPESAWYAFRAYFRGGLWTRAADWGELGLEEYGNDHRFRGARDQVAHANQLAGRYARAVEHWDLLANDRTSLGRSARWFAAWATSRTDNLADAKKRLTEVMAAGGEDALAATYYRGKVRLALGDEAGARSDWRSILDGAPESWYALLLRSRWRALPDDPDPALLHQGRWWGAPQVQDPSPPPDPGFGTPPVADPRVQRIVEPLPPEIDWARLAWSPNPLTPGETSGALPVAPLPTPGPDEGYVAGRFYDPVAAEKTFRAFAEEHADLWPTLPALFDLATVGVYEITGPAVADLYEEWYAARRQRTPREVALRRQVQLSKAEWRQIFLYARDHHHAARFSMGLERLSADPDEARAAMRLAFPTPERAAMDRWGREYDLDPLLAYGLMRQESLYRHTALSHAGAVGLMQIMPLTGSKVAALLDEPDYSPAALELPEVNVRYGSYYLSRLLTRFEGGWPLAVASYNAGPVNVSSWYQAWKGRITTDDFVEQIPLKETRNYVKRVAEFYGVYVALYGPPDAVVHVPSRPGEDRREVIDF
ncbi:MAG: transglycosylase SLT domain-containing protein [Alphaproteobacteria bacterium]|nr:transglycosylase SLT domain-containing protein [Alphaproteobacteria bacterium]